MRLRTILTTTLRPSNAPRDADLRDRLELLRPLLLGRQGAALIASLVAALALVGWLPIRRDVALLAAGTALLSEIEIVLLLRARTVTEVERWLAGFACAYLTVAAATVHLSHDLPWIAPLIFATVLLISGAALAVRPLALVTAYASLAFAAAVLAEAAGWLPQRAMFAGEAGMVRPHPSTLLSFATIALVSGLGLPAIATAACAISHRLHSARQYALRATRAEFDQEVVRKTAALEEQNRYLGVINAVSFALSGPIDDAGALERACRLIARVLQVDSIQLFVPARDGVSPERLRIAAEGATTTPLGVPDALMARVAAESQPITRPGKRSTSEPPEAAAPAADEATSFAVVPMVAKGRSVGSVAAVADRPGGWDEQELHMLLLVGRELGVTLENCHLYNDALLRVQHEALLNDVVRVLSASEDATRALSDALELVASHTGARFATIERRWDRARLPEQIARYMRSGADPGPALARAMLTSPMLIADRTRPFVLGHGGEAPLSAALAAEGLITLAMAPVVCTDAEAAERTHAFPKEQQAVQIARRVVVGALCFAADGDVRWGPRDFDLFARLADLFARRFETDVLLRLQQQRIAELSALADIAAVVESTVDSQRLHSGFARAVCALVPYQHLYVALIDEHGDLAQVTMFGANGSDLGPAPFTADDQRHPWFSRRGPQLWSAATTDVPTFVDAGDRHGVLVPLRPKGQVIGIALFTTAEPPRTEQESLAAQAVEQFALALDSATLYRQATERAARIQVLGNLAAIVASVADLREAFAAFAEEVRWLIPFDRAVMLLIDEPADTFESYATYPHGDTVAHTSSFPLAGSLAAAVVAAAGPIALGRDDPRYAEADWRPYGDGVRAMAAVPVLHGGVCTAVFALARQQAQGYAGEDLTALEEVAGLLAVTIERLRLYERAEHNARHDPLTGLPNARYLHERLQDLRAGLGTDGESALLMIDMDDLKIFNDTLGHDAGDAVLCIVAREIRAACRTEDFVARTGGDEFVVVLEHANVETACAIAERVHERLLGAHREVPGAPASVRVSIGVAASPSSGDSAADLLPSADQAMYEAKFSGGARTRVADGPGAGSVRSPALRANRLLETLVRTTTVAASDEERTAVRLARRYCIGAAVARGAPTEAVEYAREALAVRTVERFGRVNENPDHTLAVKLLHSLCEEWEQQQPESAAAMALVADVALEIAWLQAPAPLGQALSLDEAARRLSRRMAAPEQRAAIREVVAAARAEQPARAQRGQAA